MTSSLYEPTDDEQRAFREHGFLVTPPLFDAATLDAVREEIHQWWETRTTQIARSNARGAASMADYSRVRPELQRLHLDSPRLSAFCRSDALVRVARALVGPDADLSWNQAYTKIAGSEARTEIPWHQDDWYAEIDGARINCWVAISKTTVDNGTLVRAPLPSALLPHVWDERLLFYRCVIDESTAEPIELEPGQAFVFTGALPHRSGVNVSSDPRVAYSISFAAPSARLKANGEAFGDRVPVLRDGLFADALVREALRTDDDSHLGRALIREIRARAPSRSAELDAHLDASREADRRGAEREASESIGRALAFLPDSDEVLGDLVRSRARVDQLLREVPVARAASAAAERALLERILSLEPGQGDAKRALAQLDAREASARPSEA